MALVDMCRSWAGTLGPEYDQRAAKYPACLDAGQATHQGSGVAHCSSGQAIFQCVNVRRVRLCRGRQRGAQRLAVAQQRCRRVDPSSCLP